MLLIALEAVTLIVLLKPISDGEVSFLGAY